MSRLTIDGDTTETAPFELTGIDLPEIERDEISVGDPVEVRTRFDQAWARGFEVAEVDDGGYRLRRNSDGALLPVGFDRADLRRRADA